MLGDSRNWLFCALLPSSAHRGALNTLKKKKFTYLAAPGLTCGIRDLVPPPGIEHRPPALGAQSLSHWTTKEVPSMHLYK